MTVTVNVNLRKLENARIDLTKEMEHCADLIAQEMRGNVKAGLDVHGVSLTPNKPATAKRKIMTLGHARPLIAEERALVSPSFYSIVRKGMNWVRIGFRGIHPGSGGLTVGQIAYIHNYGLGKNPVREFAGATTTAVKRVIAYLNDTIARYFK
jgi:hypothetical protein